MNQNGPAPQAQQAPVALAMRQPDYDGLRMVVSPAEALVRVHELQAFVKEVMVKDIDYGVIPGTGNKPTLYQPGAQKLCEIYGLAQDFEPRETIEDWDRGLFVYKIKCILTRRRDGLFIGSGFGSCNSREDKYGYRWVNERDVPNGIDKSTLKKKTFSGQNGNWTKFRMPNEDVYSLVNTIEKMACKRALIAAVNGVTRSSGIFTQDVEDLPEDAFGEAEAVRSWERGEPATGPDHASMAAEITAQIKLAKNMDELGKVANLARAAALPKEFNDEVKKVYAARREALGGANGNGAAPAQNGPAKGKAAKGAAAAAQPASPPPAAKPAAAPAEVHEAEFDEGPRQREIGEEG